MRADRGILITLQNSNRGPENAGERLSFDGGIPQPIGKAFADARDDMSSEQLQIAYDVACLMVANIVKRPSQIPEQYRASARAAHSALKAIRPEIYGA